jgi:uncharacterized protein (DUF885 family)
MNADYKILLDALQNGVRPMTLTSSDPSEISPDQILSDLREQIRSDFPEASAVDYQVKEVPDSLAPYLSPAFYLTPPLDDPQQNIIYINPSYSMDQTDLITTLAHEGYPGHLYQNAFETGDSFPPVRSLFYVGGYTEGWGLYSEMYAYDFLGLTSDEAAALRALSSLNYAVCARLDLEIHGNGWTEDDCTAYLKTFGIIDPEQIHKLYLNILEEPSNYLKYYLGYLEICNLKESALALSDVTLYDFHKWFLETGPAPFSVLTERLETLKVSSEFLHGPGENIQFLSFEPFHDSLNHLFMEIRMLLVSSDPLIRQREKDDSLILCAADTGYISLLHQAVDGGG